LLAVLPGALGLSLSSGGKTSSFFRFQHFKVKVEYWTHGKLRFHRSHVGIIGVTHGTERRGVGANHSTFGFWLMLRQGNPSVWSGVSYIHPHERTTQKALRFLRRRGGGVFTGGRPRDPYG